MTVTVQINTGECCLLPAISRDHPQYNRPRQTAAERNIPRFESYVAVSNIQQVYLFCIAHVPPVPPPQLCE